MRRVLVPVLVSASAFAMPAMGGEDVLVTFEGVLTEVNDSGSLDLEEIGLVPGVKFSGSILYHTELIVEHEGENHTLYTMYLPHMEREAGVALEGLSPPILFAPYGVNDLSIWNNGSALGREGDRFEFHCWSPGIGVPSGTLFEDFWLDESTIRLVDSTGQVFSDTSLPTRFDLSDFDTALFYTYGFALPGAGATINIWGEFTSLEARPVPGFVRGDSNTDGRTDLSDAIRTLIYLFDQEALLEPVVCLDAMDSNDDSLLDLSDPVHTLTWMFSGATTMAEPFPSCGFDPTPDVLHCEEFAPCL